MPEPEDKPPQGGQRGRADALRIAIERTLEATAAPAAETRDRAGRLLDEIARRGREAGEELARRGQATREEIARAIDELIRRRVPTRGGPTAPGRDEDEDEDSNSEVER
jgi:hypothetical protein